MIVANRLACCVQKDACCICCKRTTSDEETAGVPEEVEQEAASLDGDVNEKAEALAGAALGLAVAR